MFHILHSKIRGNKKKYLMKPPISPLRKPFAQHGIHPLNTTSIRSIQYPPAQDSIHQLNAYTRAIQRPSAQSSHLLNTTHVRSIQILAAQSGNHPHNTTPIRSIQHLSAQSPNHRPNTAPFRSIQYNSLQLDLPTIRLIQTHPVKKRSLSSVCQLSA